VSKDLGEDIKKSPVHVAIVSQALYDVQQVCKNILSRKS
jgi:hypothetical protein